MKKNLNLTSVLFQSEQTCHNIYIYILNVVSVKFLFHLCSICAKIMDEICEIQTKLRVKFQSSKERN